MEMEQSPTSEDTDSPLQGTASDGPVGDLTLKEFVLINPPKISSYLHQKCQGNGCLCTVCKARPNAGHHGATRAPIPSLPQLFCSLTTPPFHIHDIAEDTKL
jgi:hypothetical protein